MTTPVDTSSEVAGDDLLQIGSFVLESRLIVGSGRYQDVQVMSQSLDLSGSDCVTVAVRRERLHDRDGENLLDHIDPQRFILLPNTAGCYSAGDAVRVARLGREILRSLGNPGADWVKLEVLGDTRTLLPDPVATLEATRLLVEDGFQVLCYTSDDPIIAQRLKQSGMFWTVRGANATIALRAAASRTASTTRAFS